MTSRNDITGDKIQSKPSTDKYRDGWDAIFGKWERNETQKQESQKEDTEQCQQKPSLTET